MVHLCACRELHVSTPAPSHSLSGTELPFINTRIWYNLSPWWFVEPYSSHLVTRCDKLEALFCSRGNTFMLHNKESPENSRGPAYYSYSVSNNPSTTPQSLLERKLSGS